VGARRFALHRAGMGGDTAGGPLPGQRYTLETIFSENSMYPTSHLLSILLRKGLRERRCEGCGLTEWQGVPIPIEVHHANGINNDHRHENLRLFCPNCHALTPTWRGRKNRKELPPKPPKTRRARAPKNKDGYVKYVKRHREEWIAANGPCKKCGSREGLVAAYVDPSSTRMRASLIWQQSAGFRAAELAKCQVICGQCYLATQAAERRTHAFRHGTRFMYKKHKCRCVECRAWNAARSRQERDRARSSTTESFGSLVKSESRRCEIP
jgi:hypothetical protein